MESRRWPALDGLRGIAILLVVASHSGMASGAGIASTGGMVGVTLFFVLSGFLITYFLLEERESSGKVDLKAFYGRRALRLLPALSFYLVGIAILIWAFRLSVPIWSTTWPAATYISNYVQVAGADLFANRHTWSLAVEEHFYLLWPLLVVLGATKKLRLLALAIGVLAAWRLLVGTQDLIWAYVGTDTNAYALGVGCLLACLQHRGVTVPIPSRTAEVGIGGLVLLSLVPFTDQQHLYQLAVWVPLVGALLSGLVIWAAVTQSPSFLTGRVLVWFGGISYALYLWHAPLVLFPTFDGPLGILAALVASTVLAAVSWKLIEAPISRSRLRQKLAHRDSVVGVPHRHTSMTTLISIGAPVLREDAS